ncbi:hypothetical protein NL676_020311 [Syzygium grande]|nr:hypothetical protein NL676_020311 [Syzygium grande]
MITRPENTASSTRRYHLKLAGLRIPRMKLGTQGLEVSELGFGCMGLTDNRNDPALEEARISIITDAGISIITNAFAMGITFFDTSDIYGPKINEIIVGKALKKLPREEVQLATKFGAVKIEADNVVIKGTTEYVRSCCELNLERLGVEYIDLCYVHRIDMSVPIEETMEELKKLVEEGKVKYIGLSEASPDTIRRAHVVHPITALQMDWSLWTRDIEQEIIPLCRELGIGIVPYSPLGRGFFGGRGVTATVPAKSSLVRHPRFQAETMLAIAWVLHQGDDVVPIPGTMKIKNLGDNIGSLGVKLTEEDVKEISDAVPIEDVAGDRNNEHFVRCSWKYANTPPRDGK